MQILLVHQNFPGQYRQLAPALKALGHQVVAIAAHDRPVAGDFEVRRYDPSFEPIPHLPPGLASLQEHWQRAEQVAVLGWELRQQGFMPDICLAHSGWGEALLLKDVWPGMKLLLYPEIYARPEALGYGFDPGLPPEPPLEQRIALRHQNQRTIQALSLADAGIVPTEYQRRSFPEREQTWLHRIHDGIDTVTCHPRPGRVLCLEAGLALSRQDKLVTLVNRNLEPTRGFPQFMRAIPAIQARHPDAWFLIVGGDSVSYSPARPDGRSYREAMLAELEGQINLERVRFLGRLPYEQLIGLLQASSAHVYFTTPYVLSWSMLEAMSCGALIVGSRTAPVEEVLRHGDNGLLVDFFDTAALAETISQVLDQPEAFEHLRRQARRTILDHYDLPDCLLRQLQLIHQLIRS